MGIGTAPGSGSPRSRPDSSTASPPVVATHTRPSFSMAMSMTTSDGKTPGTGVGTQSEGLPARSIPYIPPPPVPIHSRSPWLAKAKMSSVRSCG